MKNKRTKIKIWKSILVLAVLIICNAFPKSFVNAENANIVDVENEEDAIINPEDGIVKIKIVYFDESDKTYFIREGTGFLIGDVEDEQSVVTSKQLIDVDETTLKKLRKKNKLDSEERLKKQIQVIATNDVTIEAEVEIDSMDLNCVVLSLDSPLHNKKSLKLGDSDVLQTEQSVYTLEIQENTDKISNCIGKIQELNKKVNENIYIVHTAKGKNTYFGTPLLNPTGTVIGVCTGEDENGYSLAIPVKALREILDVMGVPYGIVESMYYPLQEAIAKAEEQIVNTKKYTEESIAQLKIEIEVAKEVLESKESTEDTYGEALKNLEKVQDELITIGRKLLPLQIALAIVIVLLVIVDIVLMLKIKKEKPKVNKRKQKDLKERDFEATISLDDIVKMPEAFLVKDGTRIAINKMVFRIGKAEGQVDYAILGNKAISRHHADIVCENGFFFVIDRESLNHTMINGKVLISNKKTAIRNKDRVKFANEEYTFEIKG